MKRRELLEAALELVHEDRNRSYGEPTDNLGRTAELWSTWFGIPISGSDVAACMVLVKMARLVQTPDHMDSWLDVAGWAACGAEVS